MTVPGVFYLGPFSIDVALDGGKDLSIKRGDKTLLSTVHGASFLSLYSGVDDFTEGYGTFAIKDHDILVATDFAFEELAAQTPDSLAFTGACRHVKDGRRIPISLTLKISNKNLQSAMQLEFQVSLLPVDDRQDETNKVFITLASDPTEKFVGLGEQFGHFNLKGQVVPIMVREDGVGRGLQPLTFMTNQLFGPFAGGDSVSSYKPVPHYISSRKVSLFLENKEYSRFDFSVPDRVVIKVAVGASCDAKEKGVRGRLTDGHSFKDLVCEYTAYSGRMKPLPDWALDGVILGIQGGESVVETVVNRTLSAKVPVAALWLQDWCGKRTQTVLGRTLKRLWWNWESDSELYPNWPAFIEKLGDIKVLSYVNTFLADVETGGKPTFRRNLYREAEKQGFLVMDQNNRAPLSLNSGPNFKAGLVDIFNPKAFEWLKRILVAELSLGVNGWMADFGEFLPPGAHTIDGVASAADHNRYAEVWSELQESVLDQVGRDDKLIFHRSGFTQSPGRTSLFWTGDQLVTWDRYDGIKAGLTGLLSGGLSGFTLNHSDVGGYTTFSLPVFGVELGHKRSKELLLRWMELGAFCVVFRTHEGSMPDANVQFYSDSDTLAHMAHCGSLFKSLKRYKKELMDEAWEDGLPLVRPMMLEFPDDPEAFSLTDQFMFGDSILVAPVLDPNTTQVRVYLPDASESWIHLWTMTEFETGWIDIDAPLGQPAVFIRESDLNRTSLKEFLAWLKSASRSYRPPSNAIDIIP